MADEGSNLTLALISFLIGLAIGTILREFRRSYVTEFIRDPSGRIIQIMERAI